MNPFVHYVITLKALKDKTSALCSFACDINPAKEVLHRKLYFDGGVLLFVHSLNMPINLLKGVIAHLVQDAVWDSCIRDQIRGNSIWVHRMHETFWTRRFFENRDIPKINYEELLPCLKFFGNVNMEDVRKHVDKLYWLLEADEEEVHKFYDRLIGYHVEPITNFIDDDIIEKLIKITKMLL